MPTDWYAILEVEPTASPGDIRTAYRKQALRSHPDRAPLDGKEDATARFRMIAEAYEVLGDDRRRWEYDRFEFPLVEGGIPVEGFGTNSYASTSPNGHTFVWESSFDSARRAQQARNAPEGFPRRTFDPFELFNSVFSRDFHETESLEVPTDPMDDPFGTHGGNGLRGEAEGRSAPAHAPSSPFTLLSGGARHTTTARESAFTSAGHTSVFRGSPHGAGETRRTTTINGRRETVITKRDGQGNETIRKITPEGETVYINGELQSTIELPAAPADRTPTPDTSADASPRTGPARRRKWKLF